MAKCANCGSIILFGGKIESDLRFCGEGCRKRGLIATVQKEIPEEIVQQYLDQIHNGPCPKCQGPGPVDIHEAFYVYSFIFTTEWKTEKKLTCTSCARKIQVGAFFRSALLGFGGFLGPFITPYQMIQNIIAIFSPPNPDKPSKQLRDHICADLGQQLIVLPQDAPEDDGQVLIAQTDTYDDEEEYCEQEAYPEYETDPQVDSYPDEKSSINETSHYYEDENLDESSR